MGRRFARDHVTDDAEGLVGNEQQPEVELDTPASTSKPEEVRPSAKKKPIFAKLLNVTTKFGRQKSTTGSEGKGKRRRKKDKTTKSPPEVNNQAPSCSGLFDSELDRLIAVEEPEAETSTNDDVISAVILHIAEEPEEGRTAGDGETVAADSRRLLSDGNAECECVAGTPDGQPEVDDVTRQHGGADKHRKRKRAKRYAKRVRISTVVRMMIYCDDICWYFM